MKLTVNDITIELGGKEIVKSLSLQANSDEFIGLLGPNGSGKSTLLKAIYQILRYQKGEIKLNNRNIKMISLKEISKEMSVVGQFHHVPFEFTVLEMVLMGRTPHLKPFQSESKHDYDLALQALDKVGMAHAANQKFSILSGGEKQRIILARALTQEPNVLILDEPTNHLDIKYQIQILSLVKQLNICVIAALHDLSLAAQFCDRIYVIKNGVIQAEGGPKDVITIDMIKQVYEIDCDICYNEKTKTFMISYYTINT